MPKAVAAAGPMPPRVVAALQRSSVQHPTFVIPCDDLLPPSTSALAVAAEGERGLRDCRYEYEFPRISCNQLRTQPFHQLNIHGGLSSMTSTQFWNLWTPLFLPH